MDSLGRLHDLEFHCPRCGAGRDRTSLSLTFAHAALPHVPPMVDRDTPLPGQPLLDAQAATTCCPCRFSLRVWDLAITAGPDGRMVLTVRPRERAQIGAPRGR